MQQGGGQRDDPQDDSTDAPVTQLEIGTNLMQELVVNGRTLIGIQDGRVYFDPRYGGEFTYAASAGRALISGSANIESVSIDANTGELRIGETVFTEQVLNRLLVHIRDTGNDVTVVHFDVE